MVEIVQYDPDQHHRMLRDFLLVTYPNPDYVMHSVRFLRWQYFDNPTNCSGEYTLKVVINKRKIIGQLGIIPINILEKTGLIFCGAYPVNLMVLSGAQSFGLGALLMRHLLQSTPYIVNLGSSVEGLRLCSSLGMHDKGCLTRFIRVIDSECARTLHSNGIFDVTDCSRSKSGSNCTISSVLPSDLCLKAMPTNAVIRDVSYLKWRYADHPTFKYLFAYPSTLDAVLVFRLEDVMDMQFKVCRIVDFIGAPQDMECLLGTVVDHAERCGAVLCDFYCSLPEKFSQILNTAGFIQENPDSVANFASLFQPLSFHKTRIRFLLGGKAFKSATQDFYLTKGDSDQDRPNSAKQVEDIG